MQTQIGTLWGVSVGPGDPELLTLKGWRVLHSVPVVACPQARSGQLGLAYEIVQGYLSSGQRILSLSLPFVTDPGVLQHAWCQAVEQLLIPLQGGEDVAFVCEGDVGLYSTFTHLARTLRQLQPQVSIQIIPGVCSPLAAAAALGQPLSIGSQRLAILPAMYTSTEVEQVCQWADVVVLMKVAPVFPQVYRWLQHKHLLSNACLIEWVSHDRQQIWTDLTPLDTYQPPYFSLLILQIPEQDRSESRDPKFNVLYAKEHREG